MTGVLPGVDRLLVPGGTFLLGEDADQAEYPEESPALLTAVGDLLVDRTPVTNAGFADFVRATGHVTVAERTPDPADFPGVDEALLVPGSLVVDLPDGPVDLRVPSWWRWVPGADWCHPEGPGSDLGGRQDHPVVHVALADARAYADWTGADLPTEPEWERAARAGTATRYPWGQELAPGGRRMAHTWPGDFPGEGRGPGPFTAPVGSCPPNALGLLDMIGNVWEWTSSPWIERRDRAGCCSPSSASGPELRVLKGGSFLCAANYCRRYRPAARTPQEVATSTAHTGFRCVVRPD